MGEVTPELKQKVQDYFKEISERSFEIYSELNQAGIARELARSILPVNLYTEWYWSGTLMAFARVCNLRCKSDTQWETQLIAEMIDLKAKELFPVSWEALRVE